MSRSFLRVGAALLGVVGIGAAPLPPSAGGETSPTSPGCLLIPEPRWLTETVRDWVSFEDQLSVIRVVDEARLGDQTPTPEPGYVGRRVTVVVERTLWRRGGAPHAPTRLDFVDWGWCATEQGLQPAKVEQVTRLQVGRRYLTPLTKIGNRWTAIGQGRLRMRGSLVVGGVDYSTPVWAHQVLAGRRVGSAGALVRHTRPYRAALRLAHRDPVRRAHAADRDGYRIAGTGRVTPVIVGAGRTARSRWSLFVVRRSAEQVCLRLAARPIWPGGSALRGARCGARSTANDETAAVGTASSVSRGSFVFGTAWSNVDHVRIRFRSGRPVSTRTLPSPGSLRSRDRYWVLDVRGRCPVSVDAFDYRGRFLGRRSVGRAIGDSMPGCSPQT